MESIVSKLKKARKSAAVVKMDLISLRGGDPATPVLVFEGPDDTPAYFQWIQKIAPDLEYEPFSAGGKDFVLQVKDIIDRDLGDLGLGVFFFVDRDFDDLRGMPADPQRLFMTDRYSIESYFVCEGVLDRLLIHYYQCSGAPAVRNSVCADFTLRYEEFLTCANDVNFRVFLARKLGIGVKGGLPDKISSLALVNLTSVSTVTNPPEKIVQLSREPTPAEVAGLLPAFISLNPRDRHRGKFSLLFFSRWLELLAADRVAANSHFFGDLPKSVKIRPAQIGIDAMAARSAMPKGLDAFIKGIAAQCPMAA